MPDYSKPGRLYDNPEGREAGRRFDTASSEYPSRRRRGRGDFVLGAGRYGGVTVPALPVRFGAGMAGGFPDVAIGRRIAGIAEAGGRTGNRFRLRGRPGVPWGVVRGSGVPVVRPGRVRPVGRRAAAPAWRAYPFRAWRRPLRRRYRPALPVRFVASSAGGFADVAIGRRIAGIAGSGSRTGNRLRLRGLSGVPWGAVRGSGPGGAGRGGSVP